MKVPHYTKAPITEALIDIQVRLPEQVATNALSTIVEADEAKYRRPVALRQSTFEFRFGPEQQSGAQHEERGFLFPSADGKHVVQARRDGFTFSRLAPYDRWEDFRNEAKNLWLAYRNIATPETITRVAVKYVNRFDLVLPVKDFGDFFKIYPEVPPELPQGLAGFFMQLQIPHDDLAAMLVLTQAIVPPPEAGIVSIVLDIDLFCPNNPAPTEEELWLLLERLHDRKNQIFESCITDATRELIR
jgi:uncharacterized protein (TIGR04255 family)